MTAKSYYITTLADWQRHAHRFAQSHWIALDAPDGPAKILVLVEADEGAHLALEDDPAFEALPHPLAQKSISESAQSALSSLGIQRCATTFETSEAVSRVHPLLKHRVF